VGAFCLLVGGQIGVLASGWVQGDGSSREQLLEATGVSEAMGVRAGAAEAEEDLA